MTVMTTFKLGRPSISRGIGSLIKRGGTRQPKRSERFGMGANPYRDGTAFRVWVPNADAVYVVGTFNKWSQTRHPLAGEGNGYWSADIRGAWPGDEYKYLIETNGRTQTRTDPYARDVSYTFNNAVITADKFKWGLDHNFQPPDWQDLVIYELHVGTFGETCQANYQDGEFRPGQFDDTIEKLPYLRELGINAIEIMPVKAFPGDLSWGYNPSHPFAITRVYGGRDALKRLIKAAHEHEIAVIMDVVYNHFGPGDLEMWQFDGWSENQLGGIYFYNDHRAQTPWGHTRPDYGREEVRNYIIDNVRMWFDEFRVDGLRLDATSYIRTVEGFDWGEDIADGWRIMQEINDELSDKYAWKMMIAEDLQRNEWLTKPTSEGGAGFGSQWDSAFVHTIRHNLITPFDEDRNMEQVVEALTTTYNGNPLERIIYTESHDEVANGKARVPEEIDPGAADSVYARKRSALGAALVFTTPGIPMIFQGQEFLEDSWFRDDDPLDWQKAKDNAGMVELYRELIALRQNRGGNTAGLRGNSIRMCLTDDEAKMIAYHRWSWGGVGDDVMVVANFAHDAVESEVQFPADGVWKVRLNSDLMKYDPTFGDHVVEDVIVEEGVGTINVAGYTAVILSQD